VTVDGKAQWANNLEDDENTNEYLPCLKGDNLVIVPEPTSEKVHDYGEGKREGNCVVRKDIAENSEF
jgi:hypothetical protein